MTPEQIKKLTELGFHKSELNNNQYARSEPKKAIVFLDSKRGTFRLITDNLTVTDTNFDRVLRKI